VIAAVVAGIALGGAAFWVLFVVLGLGTITWVAFGQMLPYAWPLGIRLDSDGLRVGGVGGRNSILAAPGAGPPCCVSTVRCSPAAGTACSTSA
jgi:hypothetical protein